MKLIMVTGCSDCPFRSGAGATRFCLHIDSLHITCEARAWRRPKHCALDKESTTVLSVGSGKEEP